MFPCSAAAWKTEKEGYDTIAVKYGLLKRRARTEDVDRQTRKANPFAPWEPRCPKVHISATLRKKSEDVEANRRVVEQCVAVEISRIGLPSLKVYNVYHPPPKSSHTNLDMEPFPMDDTVIIAGDLNTHHPDWSHGAINAGGRNLKDWLVEVSAMVCNNPAVHTMLPRPGIRDSSPDVVITSRTPGLVLNWRRLDSWKSDHYPIAFEVPRGYRQPRAPRPKWFSWKRADWEEMMIRLEAESAALLANRPATNTQFAKRIASCFRRAIHDFVPKHTQGRRAYKAWWTPELTILEREKATAFAELQAEPDSPDKICAHLEKLSQFSEAATRAKTSHWDKIAVRINRCTGVALLFRQVRMLDGRGGQHQSIPPLWNGKAFCVDAKGKAELFGRHLEAVCGGASAVPSHRWAPKKRPSDDDIGCGPISEDELDRALKDLDPKTSLDPDGICSEFLSRLDGGAKRLVLELLNISWDEGFVPDSWRDAHVIPAAKPGRDHSLPEGYRPISLTSVTSKLMEVIVKNRLVFLTENDSVTQVLPFCTRQGGFRRQRGTEEQLYSIVTTIDCAGPTFRRVCLLSFDLANAFDTVDHALLLDAMQSKGVPPKFLVWLESFLRNRKAAFKVDGATGEKFHLKHGVPQGTVLGPVLFLYHIDDLGTSLEALNKRIVADSESRSWINFSLFADDDGVVVSSPSHFQLEKYTQEVVDVVEEWTFKAKMHLSKLKTEGVLFRDPGAPEPYPVTTRFNATAVDVLVPDDYVIALKSRSTWKFLEPDEHSPWHQHHGKLIVSVDEKNGGDKDATKNRLVTIRVADALRWVDKTKLLGLVIDSELTFVPHMQRVVDKFSLKMNFLRHLSGKSFGCNSCTLRTLYLTYVLPTYTYALSVYGPYLLRSTSPLVTTLERLHRRAQVILLGCRKNTSDFSAQQESGILPLRAIANLRVAALRERMRLRSTLWQNDLAMNTTLRRSYDALCEKAGTVECKREAFVFNPFAPWTPSPKVTIVATLPGKKGDSAAEKRRIVESRLNRLEPPDCSAWIDGSVLDGAPPPQPPPSIADRWDERHRPWLKRYADKTAWGGAGLYFEFEPSITPSLRDVADLKTATGNRHTTSRSSPVGKHVHSYRAEQVALYSALVFLRQHLAPTSRPLHILVLSDSQSFLKTLSAGPHSQVEPLAIECWTILSEMEARGYDVTLHFVYGHCGLEGNDAADVLAKAAALGYRRAAGASSSDHPEPFPLTVAGAVCRYRTYLRLNSSEAGAKEAFERADGHGNLSPFARIVHGRPIPRRRHLTPRAEREVRQLRTGHHRLIMTLYATDWRSFSEAELQRAAYKIDGATGRSFDLNTGVPQGTVLGPLLFLYYIDDLGSDLDRLQRRIHQDNVGATITFSLYADDDGVAVEARTFAALEQYAQDVVDVVERWTAQALMSLSVLKTRGVFFVGKNAAPFPPPNVVFKATRADVPVPPADTERRVSAEGRLVGTNTPHDGKTFVGIAFGPVTEANAGLTLLHSVVTLQWVDKVKLLGLTIDQGFTFLPHLQRVVDGFSLRMNLLRHLAGKDYGFNGTVLRTLYLSYVLPTYTYALGIYGPFILPANGPLTTLERMHRRALTLILGCRKGVAEFAGQQETGILPIRALAKCRIAALREKVEFNKVLWAHELSLDTLLKSTSDNIRKKAGTDGCRRELRDFHLFAPWVPRPDVEIYTSLKVRKHASNAEKKQAVLKRLAELPHPDCVAWPDGSVVHGDPPLPSICDANASAALRPWLRSTADRTTWGAAGVFIDLGPSVTIKPDHGLPVKPTGDRRTFDASLPAGKHPHSYRAEEFALYSCLKFLLRLLPPTPTPLNILVLSDSQSLLMTLSHGPHCQTQPYPIAIWLHLAELESLGYTVTLQFVFGHCGLEGNERADKTAKRGALAFMRAATDAAAKNQPPPLSARLCATAANGRYRSVLWLESSEAGARDALDRATLLRNPSSFARLVFGRRIPRPKHLAPRAEREVRQLRTGHHHLVMTMYATEWRDLSRADRRQAFLPCPICGTRSLAPLLHLFVGCDAPAAVQSRLTMDADLDAKSRLRSKPPPADAMERLWAILFVFPELALAYLQRCGTLPSYAILAGQASGEPVGGGANRSITPDAASSRSADSEDAISR
ncbi:RNA-directed DNA polymerase from mobile element jockey [Diplonema papillatum]|nr:RNA-directed DNA polymerase from mobile element jockey [Diplonema papillatum]